MVIIFNIISCFVEMLSFARFWLRWVGDMNSKLLIRLIGWEELDRVIVNCQIDWSMKSLFSLVDLWGLMDPDQFKTDDFLHIIFICLQYTYTSFEFQNCSLHYHGAKQLIPRLKILTSWSVIVSLCTAPLDELIFVIKDKIRFGEIKLRLSSCLFFATT